MGKNVTRLLQNAQLKGKPTEGEWFSNAHAFAMLSFPGGSAPCGVELWSEAVVTDYGVRAPPGGVCRECQVRARGPLDSKLSPAVLYQYRDQHGDERVEAGIIMKSAVSKRKPALVSAAAEAEKP